MELSQALILTNALGGLSSLGRAGQRRPARSGGWRLELNGRTVEVVCGDGQIHIRLCEKGSAQAGASHGGSQNSKRELHARDPQARAGVSSTPGRHTAPEKAHPEKAHPEKAHPEKTHKSEGLPPRALSGLVPGRLILSSYNDVRAVDLRVEGDRLTADVILPEGPFLFALELTFDGKSYRSRPLLMEGEPLMGT